MGSFYIKFLRLKPVSISNSLFPFLKITDSGIFRVGLKLLAIVLVDSLNSIFPAKANEPPS